jgi:hypothetical protein
MVVGGIALSRLEERSLLLVMSDNDTMPVGVLVSQRHVLLIAIDSPRRIRFSAARVKPYSDYDVQEVD